MRVLGIIPARGGSKGIPGKNLAKVRGRPLIAYTCEAAVGSRRLDRVLVSTDSEEIACVAEEYGVEAPFRRPAELATDETPILPVLQHAVEWVEERTGTAQDAVMVLQPTSPLRTAAHIDEAIERFEDARPATLVSVVAVPHNFHPLSIMVEQKGLLVPYHAGEEMVLRRQDKPVAWARNGPAILIVARDTLRNNRLYGHRIIRYQMGRIESLDVDEPEDLDLLSCLLERRQS